MRRFAVLGHPIAHSLSPRMHAAALAELGLASRYEALDVATEPALDEALQAVREGALDGVNVTLPWKTHVHARMDHVEEDAARAGAVNTVLRRLEGDRPLLVGANTDVPGLGRSLAESGVVLAGAHVVVLGAGGAARAAVQTSRRGGAASVVVAARRPETAEALVRSFDDASLRALGLAPITPELSAAFAGATLVLQTTSATLGAVDAPIPRAFVDALPLAALPADALVFDAVYRPRETALLAAARARGLRTVDGVGMLVHQGALALSRWLGVSPEAIPVEAMRAAALDALAG